MKKENLEKILKIVKRQHLTDGRDRYLSVEELLKLVKEELLQEFLRVKGLDENTQTIGLLNAQFNLGDISAVLDKVLPND